jgi:hypothetical protein
VFGYFGDNSTFDLVVSIPAANPGIDRWSMIYAPVQRLKILAINSEVEKRGSRFDVRAENKPNELIIKSIN